MAQEIINIGLTPNDKSGDPLRTAFNKVNLNFSELYATRGGTIRISATAPIVTDEGSLWWNSVDGETYIYYNNTWVSSNASSGNIANMLGDLTVVNSTITSSTSRITLSATDSIIIDSNAAVYGNLLVDGTLTDGHGNLYLTASNVDDFTQLIDKINNAVLTTGSYFDPIWLGSLDGKKLVGSITINTEDGLTGGGPTDFNTPLTLTNTDKGSSQNIFKNIEVDGQDTVSATINDDTLYLIAGNGITITTNNKDIKIDSVITDVVTNLHSGNNIKLSGSTGNITISSIDGIQHVITDDNFAVYEFTNTDQYFGTKYTLIGQCGVTLPSGAGLQPGRQFIVKDEGGNAHVHNVVIVTRNGETIDGNTEARITNNYGSLTVLWTGNKWSRI